MTNGSLHIIVTDALLSKYFSGDATPEEAMAIDQWASASEQNRLEFDAFFRSWEALSGSPYSIPDKTEIWQQIIASKPETGVIKKMGLLKWTAAACVLIAASLFAFFLLRSPSTIPPENRQVRAAAGKNLLQQLPDRSVVTLVTGSTIYYPSSFNSSERKVRLQGEGYFDVQHDAHQPFIVEAGPINVKVLGTKFNVAVGDSVITVPVYSGRIMMYNNKEQLLVPAGSTGYFYVREQKFVIENKADRNKTGYVTLNFYFEDQDLKTIAAHLSKAYHKKIYFRKSYMESLRVSSIFENKPLDYILEVIASTVDLKYTYTKPDEIYFEEK